jgi:hypothetical protein
MAHASAAPSGRQNACFFVVEFVNTDKPIKISRLQTVPVRKTEISVTNPSTTRPVPRTGRSQKHRLAESPLTVSTSPTLGGNP